MKPPKDAKVVDNRSNIIWLNDLDIVCVKVKEGKNITLKDAKAEIQTGLKLMEGSKFLLLVDGTGTKSMDKAARDFFSKSEEVNKNVIAAAIMANSIISSVIANFFIGLNETTIPVKLFTDEQKAIEWLKTFI